MALLTKKSTLDITIFQSRGHLKVFITARDPAQNPAQMDKPVSLEGHIVLQEKYLLLVVLYHTILRRPKYSVRTSSTQSRGHICIRRSGPEIKAKVNSNFGAEGRSENKCLGYFLHISNISIFTLLLNYTKTKSVFQ